MTALDVGDSGHRLRVQLTVLYAGLSIVLIAAVLAVSGLLERQGSTSVNGGSRSHNAIPGQHLDVGPLIVAVISTILAVALGWWLAGRFPGPSSPSAKATRE